MLNVPYSTGVLALQVPSEVFRLGRTRVFFRAGQISTLQKILNETGPEKGPWIFGRLQEALANRHKAKAAAEEAKVYMYTNYYYAFIVWYKTTGDWYWLS